MSPRKGDEGGRSEGERQEGIGGPGGRGPCKTETEGKLTHPPPHIKSLTGDDKSNGNYRGKNIIRNLIEVKQNLHNTAN